MRHSLTLAAVLGLLLSLTLRADIIILVDGSTVEGEILSNDGVEIVVKTSYGKRSLSKAEVKEIKKTKTAAQRLQEKIDDLNKQAKKDVKSWLALAEEAKKAGARREAMTCFEKIVALSPEDAIARKELGFVQQDGVWVKARDAAGPRAEKAPPAAKGAAAQNSDTVVDKETLKKLTAIEKFNDPNEKPVPCPKCNGTGIGIQIECTKCLGRGLLSSTVDAGPAKWSTKSDKPAEEKK